MLFGVVSNKWREFSWFHVEYSNMYEMLISRVESLTIYLFFSNNKQIYRIKFTNKYILVSKLTFSVGRREPCLNEGEEVAVDSIKDMKCFKCICQVIFTIHYIQFSLPFPLFKKVWTLANCMYNVIRKRRIWHICNIDFEGIWVIKLLKENFIRKSKRKWNNLPSHKIDWNCTCSGNKKNLSFVYLDWKIKDLLE